MIHSISKSYVPNSGWWRQQPKKKIAPIFLAVDTAHTQLGIRLVKGYGKCKTSRKDKVMRIVVIK